MPASVLTLQDVREIMGQRRDLRHLKMRESGQARDSVEDHSPRWRAGEMIVKPPLFESKTDSAFALAQDAAASYECVKDSKAERSDGNVF